VEAGQLAHQVEHLSRPAKNHNNVGLDCGYILKVVCSIIMHNPHMACILCMVVPSRQAARCPHDQEHVWCRHAAKVTKSVYYNESCLTKTKYMACGSTSGSNREQRTPSITLSMQG
jgi:hypothetical protein